MHVKHNLYEDDKLCLCSPTSGKPLSIYRDRSQVHVRGDFHLGVQAYVLTIDPSGAPQILVTKRSSEVDIARLKYDQVAIQMLQEDEQSYDRALERGLREELVLVPSSFTAIPLESVTLKVVKKYAGRPNLYNREFVRLYFVYLPRTVAQRLTVASPKLSNLAWYSFPRYARAVTRYPGKFTKTAQSYVLNPALLTATERAIRMITVAKRRSKRLPSVAPKVNLRRAEFYQYADRLTFIFNEYAGQDNKDLYIFYRGRALTYLGNIHDFVVHDDKQRQQLTLTAAGADGRRYIWSSTEYRLLER